MSEPASVARLPFSRPCISEAAIVAVGEVLRSGWITSGANVLAFEKRFCELTGAPHAIAICSGTAGLDLASHSLAQLTR